MYEKSENEWGVLKDGASFKTYKINRYVPGDCHSGQIEVYGSAALAEGVLNLLNTHVVDSTYDRDIHESDYGAE